MLTKYQLIIVYRKFSNKRTGCYDKPLGGASRLWRIFPPSRGFLQNENRTIISWDMGNNVKIDPERATQNKGVPLLGAVPLLENLRYSFMCYRQKWGNC